MSFIPPFFDFEAIYNGITSFMNTDPNYRFDDPSLCRISYISVRERIEALMRDF